MFIQKKMVNIEILEGLRQAVARGDPLQKAAQSFINAGYPQSEVEEAVYNVNTLASPQIQTPSPNPQQSLQKFPPLPIQAQSQPQVPAQSLPLNQNPPQQSTPLQQPKKDVGVGWIILLVVVLFILIGALLGTVFFKDSVVGFFNGLM